MLCSCEIDFLNAVEVLDNVLSIKSLQLELAVLFWITEISDLLKVLERLLSVLLVMVDRVHYVL